MTADIVYLACPYTHDDAGVMRARFLAVNRLAAKLLGEGVVVFSPISHSHPIAQFGLPVEWEFWEGCNRAFLERCGSMMVFRLEGWDTSTGVQAEIAIMEEMGKPISYIDL